MPSPISNLPAALARFGPGSPREAVDEATARAWCVDLARGHGENFAVLSALVPDRLRDDFAAIYYPCSAGSGTWVTRAGAEETCPCEGLPYGYQDEPAY